MDKIDNKYANETTNETTNETEIESEKGSNKLQNVIIIFVIFVAILLLLRFIYLYIYNPSNTNVQINPNNPSNTYVPSNTNVPSNTYIPSNIEDGSGYYEKPKTVRNGEIDENKVVINPTITILQAKIYKTESGIKDSIISNTLASDDYNSKYVIFSSTDKATILTADMIPNFNTNTKQAPKQIIEFKWTDPNTGKCFIPEFLNKNGDIIVLGDCSGNNANYQWEDGLIKHINSNRYLRTLSDFTIPTDNEILLLTKLPEKSDDDFKTRKFDFVQSDSNSLDVKIIHRDSSKCIFPKIGSNGKVLLCVQKC